MSGHSKWSGIKHKKAIVDAKRGKAFSKSIREITVAAKMGGGDVNANARLRLAVGKARETNMPKDTIEKAIKRGTGDLPGTSYEEMLLEVYGPSGVAILIEALTDNKNRTAAEIRNLLTKQGGASAGAGSVAWLFTKKGVLTIPISSVEEDQLMELVLEAGAEDVQVEGREVIVTTSPQTFEAVKQTLQHAGITWETAELTMMPSSTVPVQDAGRAKQLLALLDALQDQEDVQQVYANFDIPDAILEAQAASES